MPVTSSVGLCCLTSSSAIKVRNKCNIYLQDPTNIPQHKRKKPVVSEMTADAIRKGTLSMVLSSMGAEAKSTPDASTKPEPQIDQQADNTTANNATNSTSALAPSQTG